MSSLVHSLAIFFILCNLNQNHLVLKGFFFFLHQIPSLCLETAHCISPTSAFLNSVDGAGVQYWTVFTDTPSGIKTVSSMFWAEIYV